RARVARAFRDHVHARPEPGLLPRWSEMVDRGAMSLGDVETLLASYRAPYPREAVFRPDEDPGETHDALGERPQDPEAAACRGEALESFARLGPAPAGEPVSSLDLRPEEAREAEERLRALGYL
ncbi:MAG: hypothetical protein L0216_12765, partial [Planctomycetales bacterium]|nr:hypothetical protein [Planctomycetales bacterium]